jgi:hypothetical protein
MAFKDVHDEKNVQKSSVNFWNAGTFTARRNFRKAV